jgi:hypothetical protein
MPENIFDQFDSPAPSSGMQLPPVAVPPDAAATPSNVFDQFDAPPVKTSPAPGQLDWSKYNQPFGELKPADPSWSEWLRSKGQDALIALGANPYNAGKMSDIAVTGATVNPIMGSLLSGADMTYDLSRGNYGHAALDAAGMAPGGLAGTRIVKGMPLLKMADTPTTGELKTAAGNAYDAVRDSPVVYAPSAMDDLVNNTRIELTKRGLNPVKAPSTFGVLDAAGAPRPAGAIITPDDFDTLRQQLRGGVPGTQDSLAGQLAIEHLDRRMASPAPGDVLRGTAQDVDTLGRNLADARGNYRPAKLSETVEGKIDTAAVKSDVANSGKNLDNTTRQWLAGLITTKAGQRAMAGANDAERQAVRDVAKGDWLTNSLRSWGNRLGGGGGWGQTFVGSIGAGVGGGAAHMMGLDPVTSSAVAAMTGGAVPVAGGIMRSIENERTTRAADKIAELIRQRSPEYARRTAAAPPITDPFALQRDAIAYAMIPQAVQGGKNAWDNLSVPYENRDQDQP